MKNDRLFQIIYILLEKHTITAPELASQLEVSVRTIYRDIDTLSACGIPVYAVPGKNGGISLMQDFTFDKSLLSDKEQNEILFALQSMQAAGQKVDLLLSKLGVVFKKANKNWIEADFSRWGYKKTDTAKFDLLKRAILEKRILLINYASAYGQTTPRSIKPIRMIFKSMNWYVQAFCLKAQDFRTFKINRIISLVISEEYFDDEYQELPSIDGDVLSPENIIILKLRVSSQSIYRAYDEFTEGNIEWQADGSVIVCAKFPFDSWVFGYLLSFGTDVEILEPTWLKEKLIEYIEKIQKHFIT